MVTLNDYISKLQKLAETHGDKEVIFFNDERTGPAKNQDIPSEPKIFEEYSVGGQEGYFVEKGSTLEQLIGSRQMQYANQNSFREVIVLNAEEDY